jgi:L-asparagine transporter-like permease
MGMRFYTFMQKSLYGGTTIQPLAQEGFFPDKFAKLNKEKLPISASRLNIYIIMTVAVIWLIVPDVIKGIILVNQYG